LLEVGTGMHPEMTARQNIYLNGSLMGMPRHEITSKLDEIVDFAGIEKYVDTPIKRFSSGMTVRLGFAIAAFLEPEILIVDEVLAVGDAEFQKKAIGKMKDVSKGEGRTVLFVSHNLVSVKKLCTKGIILHNGLIDHEGSCDNAVNYYSNLTVKSASKPVGERKDRIGSQKMTIVDIYAENVDGVRLQELYSGESYFLKLDYQKKKFVDPKQLTIVIQFKNDKGEVVNTIATDELGTVFSKISEIGSIQIQFPKLQFREGNYSMNFLLSEKLATNLPHEIMDFVEDAYLLKVIKGDYWKSGFINRPGGFIQEAEINIT
jgi:lipopolysaccharide transport system ATP-binding protein